ncbi:polyunsaturated fatty acid lipoxygenase ALOX15B-like [Dama dama]|uniref:polyunsaturated fatty acid lipoxygenase ALOX15B-like n=1 Tax=Dama dama TaxID=30532 RepID=UPI002A358F70|nr:polyunsaturated fatty acid lipoxygenase ALOX15B-like [Dama dama]
MSKYTVRVATSSLLGSGTWDRVSVSLDGTPDESSRLRLDGFGKDFRQDAMRDFEVTPPQDVGPVLLVSVHKAPPALPGPLLPSARDAWFCRWLQLMLPGGAPLRFHCYQWLEGEGSQVLRERQFLNGLNPVLIRHCHHLSKNFPVTDAMVAPVLGPRTSLQAELELSQISGPDSPIFEPSNSPEN